MCSILNMILISKAVQVVLTVDHAGVITRYLQPVCVNPRLEWTVSSYTKFFCLRNFWTYFCIFTACVIGEVFRYRLLSVGPGADLGVDSVSPQVTLSIHPALGCHYFLPGLWLPSQLKRVTAHRLVPNYIGDRGTCMWAAYQEVDRPRLESVTVWVASKRSTVSPHCMCRL